MVRARERQCARSIHCDKPNRHRGRCNSHLAGGSVREDEEEEEEREGWGEEDDDDDGGGGGGGVREEDDDDDDDDDDEEEESTSGDDALDEIPPQDLIQDSVVVNGVRLRLLRATSASGYKYVHWQPVSGGPNKPYLGEVSREKLGFFSSAREAAVAVAVCLQKRRRGEMEQARQGGVGPCGCPRSVYCDKPARHRGRCSNISIPKANRHPNPKHRAVEGGQQPSAPLVTEAQGVKLRLSSRNKYGYHGVHKITNGAGRYAAEVSRDGQRFRLGGHKTPVEAALEVSRFLDK